MTFTYNSSSLHLSITHPAAGNYHQQTETIYIWNCFIKYCPQLQWIWRLFDAWERIVRSFLVFIIITVVHMDIPQFVSYRIFVFLCVVFVWFVLFCELWVIERENQHDPRSEMWTRNQCVDKVRTSLDMHLLVILGFNWFEGSSSVDPQHNTAVHNILNIRFGLVWVHCLWLI